MKRQTLNILTIVFSAILLVGCATTGYQQADKTGESINLVRNDVLEMKKAMDASIQALDALAASATTNPRKPFKVYSNSLERVENASTVIKAHADQMRSEGKVYFEKWEKQLSRVKNPEIRKQIDERRAKLQEPFDRIKIAAEGVKQSFPVFLSDLQDIRRALSLDLSIGGIDAAKDIFAKAKSDRVEVDKHLDALVAELNSVFATITATRN